MKTTRDYLADLADLDRRQCGTGSDYALAKRLKISRQRMSHYRRGRSGFDDYMCIKVARLLNIPAGEVLANIAASRAERPVIAKAWETAALSCRRDQKSHKKRHKKAA